jgi:hypothetical protein
MGHAYVLFGARHSLKPKRKQALPVVAGLLESVSDVGTLGELGVVTAIPADFWKECEKYGIASPTQFLDSSAHQIHQVRLADPWTGEVVTMPLEEFSRRVDFVITRTYARQILESWERIPSLQKK